MNCHKCGKPSSNLIRQNLIGEAGVFWCEYCMKGISRIEVSPNFSGSTHKERAEQQVDEWVKGNSIHNNVDDECCPDFSCCNSKNLQPEEIRKTFKYANEEQRESMLFAFLGQAIAEYIPEKKIFIANGKDEFTTPNN